MQKDPNVELKNADVNFNQYGDDSSAPNQATAGGENTKYTGEGTLNSNIAYNKNLKTTDLDPEYKYGWDAQVANSNEAGYIARRNDNIASALYNEGKRSKEDVVSFLGSQKNWNNSTEADRFNTVESVWKRIGDIQEQEDKDNTEIEVKEMEAEKKEEPKGKDVNVNTFLQGSTTELFGKMITGADTAPYDHNSNERKKAEVRLKQYQNINSMTVPQLASNIKSGSILSGGQAMKDLQTYNPEKYQQLQEYQKKEEALDQINMISSGNFTDSSTSLQNQTGESINNYLNETVANAGGDALARMDLDTALSQNQGLVNYAERMSYYQAQINQLDQTIGNLAEDARKRLGVNAYEYQIQNYINNRSKKLYKQRDNLLNQYNYYKGAYEAQVEQEATEWERDYKERQLKLQENNALWNQKMDQANLDYKYDQLNYDYYNLNGKNPISESSMQGGLDSYISAIQDKITNHGKIRQGWCGEPVNDYLGSLGVKFKYDDKKATKLNSVTPGAGPKVGSIAIWDKTGTADGDKYGHVAIVTSVNKDGTITVLESNKNTGLRYHNYKQSGVYGYYDPSANSKNSSKNTETYTNEENFRRLLGGKITYSEFLKNWNGDDFETDIEDRVGEKYFTQKPIKTVDDLSKSIKELSTIFNKKSSGGTKDERDVAETEAIKKAELYALDYLSNSNIDNKSIMKYVKEYLDKEGNADDEIVTYLSYALAGRYKDKKTLDNDLDVIGYKDSIWKKDRAKAIWKIWEEDGIVK